MCFGQLSYLIKHSDLFKKRKEKKRNITTMKENLSVEGYLLEARPPRTSPPSSRTTKTLTQGLQRAEGRK